MGTGNSGRILVPALFFLSGLSALILEVVFIRQLGWVFGSSTIATAIVLAAFMGGLALGAVLFGRMADRVASPLALYGILEIGAGLTGGLLAWSLSAGREWMLAPLRALPEGPVERTVELLLAVFVLLLPTALMGGSLPALGRYLVRSTDELLAPLGLLYGLNTLGGVAGVYLAGFHLFERAGITNCALLAAGLDVAVGGVAILVARTSAMEIAEPRPKKKKKKVGPEIEEATPRLATAALVAIGMGGLCVLGYEVIWTRLLTLPMRSFSYSFSMMLALFLLGLVLGSLAISRLGGKIRKPGLALGWLQAAIGSYVAFSLVWMPGRLLPPGAEESGSFTEFLFRSAWTAAPIVLPPTILSGAALPLAVRTLAPALKTVGSDVGRVYAFNTAGAIVGAMAAGLLLLPMVGAPKSLAIFAILNIAAGLVVLLAAGAGNSMKVFAAVLLAASLLALALPPDRFVQSFLKASRGGKNIASLVYFHEGAVDTIAVVRKNYGFYDPEAKSLVTNGVAMSATTKPVWRYMSLEGHLAVLMSPKVESGLAVGVGTGITLSAVVSHPEVKRVVAVELSEGVAAALEYFRYENGESYLDPRVDLVVEDGRHYLEMHSRSFDFITLEPPPPIVAGAVNLYSLDFYNLCKRRLKEGGNVVQWLPLHAQSLESARMVAATFLEAFENVQLWLPSVRDAVLIGSDNPLVLDWARIQRVYSQRPTALNLNEAYVESPEALLATYLMDAGGLRAWAAGAMVITDEHPYMEFFRHQGGNMDDRDIGTLLEIRQDGWDWVAGLPETALHDVLVENRALRLHVRSRTGGTNNDAVEAARISRATEYFRFPLGCTTKQLAAVDRIGSWTSQKIAAHHERCDMLLGSVTPAQQP